MKTTPDSESPQLFQKAHRKFNSIQRNQVRISRFLAFVRNLILSLALVNISNMINPAAWQESIFLTLGLLLGLMIFDWFKKNSQTSEEHFLKSMEIMFPENQMAPWEVTEKNRESVAQWQSSLDEFFRRIKEKGRRSFYSDLSGFVVPVLLALLSFGLSGLSPLKLTFNSALASIRLPGQKPVLTILQGQTESQKKEFTLSPDQDTVIELLSPNMISIRLEKSETLISPVVVLNSIQKPGDSGGEYQSFRMSDTYDKRDLSTPKGYQVSFSVSQNVILKLPAVYGDRAIARIAVKKLPLPEVTLRSDHPTDEPWPDDKPLPLFIKVKTNAPLKLVRLRIKTGNRESKELVLRVNSDKVFQWENEYELLLEPYLNSDLAEVEIVAEATDGAIPSPLTGLSQAIYINTESAYGRYRQTLTALKGLKDFLDQFIGKKIEKFPEEAADIAKEALRKSISTPFFDTLDRIQMNEFSAESAEIHANQGTRTAMDLSYRLNEFLVEHEILDDRERDRDFFVAARALSRLVEQEDSQRPVSVDIATDNLRQFLTQRRERWELRVRHLGNPDSLSRWPHIRDDKPFLKAMNDMDAFIGSNPEGEDKSSALRVLSETVSKYRSWIEELELQEDKDRQAKEMKRQHGLASARQKLQKLQKQQGKISQSLDQSMNRKVSELDEQWPVIRMKQNMNLKDTKKLEYEMRALAPQAGARIRAAVEAMELTLEYGQLKNFVKSESFSDLAGRLLRKAQKDSMSSGKNSKRRKRRRVSGDRYYGQSVHGGDLEISRDYQVDKRYREEVLNEVRDSVKSSDDARLLEDYIRKIVR